MSEVLCSEIACAWGYGQFVGEPVWEPVDYGSLWTPFDTLDDFEPYVGSL
jgi:hypothetical protein